VHVLSRNWQIETADWNLDVRLDIWVNKLYARLEILLRNWLAGSKTVVSISRDDPCVKRTATQWRPLEKKVLAARKIGIWNSTLKKKAQKVLLAYCVRLPFICLTHYCCETLRRNTLDLPLGSHLHPRVILSVISPLPRATGPSLFTSFQQLENKRLGNTQSDYKTATHIRKKDSERISCLGLVLTGTGLELVSVQTMCACRGGYGVATISRLLKIIGLFCKRALQKRPFSAKETYTFKEPTNRSHPIV